MGHYEDGNGILDQVKKWKNKIKANVRILAKICQKKKKKKEN